MNDHDLVDLFESGAFVKATNAKCPCGIQQSVAPAFHKRSTNHDCVHHPRSRCWTCKAADRMLAAVEARLHVEAERGPFEVY